MRLPCTNSKVSAEQFRLSCCCKALHATNKLISAVLQVPMLIAFWRCLGKNVVIMSKASPQVSQNPMQMEATKRTFPTWGNSTTNLTKSIGKSVTNFGAINHGLWGNPSPTLGKWATDFGKICHRLWENEPPTLGKWTTDFGEICHRLWGTKLPTLGKNWLGFRERLARFGGSWFGVWIGLEQSSSLSVLNAKHVWVWIFEVLALGVSKNKSTGRRVNCWNL